MLTDSNEPAQDSGESTDADDASLPVENSEPTERPASPAPASAPPSTSNSDVQSNRPDSEGDEVVEPAEPVIRNSVALRLWVKDTRRGGNHRLVRSVRTKNPKYIHIVWPDTIYQPRATWNGKLNEKIEMTGVRFELRCRQFNEGFQFQGKTLMPISEGTLSRPERDWTEEEIRLNGAGTRFWIRIASDDRVALDYAFRIPNPGWKKEHKVKEIVLRGIVPVNEPLKQRATIAVSFKSEKHGDFGIVAAPVYSLIEFVETERPVKEQVRAWALRPPKG